MTLLRTRGTIIIHFLITISFISGQTSDENDTKDEQDSIPVIMNPVNDTCKYGYIFVESGYYDNMMFKSNTCFRRYETKSPTGYNKCDPGFILYYSGSFNKMYTIDESKSKYYTRDTCVECEEGTFQESKTSCAACAMDTWSGRGSTECKPCRDGYFKPESEYIDYQGCIAKCVVPRVGKADTHFNNAGMVLVNGTGTNYVQCVEDYTYGGKSYQHITCITSEPNNNFPLSCRRVRIAAKNNAKAIEVGKSALLYCETVASVKIANISWYHDRNSSKRLTTDQKYKVGDVQTVEFSGSITAVSNLEIRNFTARDAGSYWCSVRYPDPLADNATLTLRILDISVDPKEVQIINSGDDLNLSCNYRSDEDYTRRVVVWSKGQTQIIITTDMSGDDSYGEHTSVLNIKTATIANSGSYRCGVTYYNGKLPAAFSQPDSSVGPIETSVKVVVRGFTVQPESKPKEADDLSLTCAVAGEGPAALYWNKTVNEVPEIVSSKSRYIAQLKTTYSVYTPRFVNQTGVYQCHANFSGTLMNSDSVSVNVLYNRKSENEFDHNDDSDDNNNTCDNKIPDTANDNTNNNKEPVTDIDNTNNNKKPDSDIDNINNNNKPDTDNDNTNNNEKHDTDKDSTNNNNKTDTDNDSTSNNNKTDTDIDNIKNNKKPDTDFDNINNNKKPDNDNIKNNTKPNTDNDNTNNNNKTDTDNDSTSNNNKTDTDNDSTSNNNKTDNNNTNTDANNTDAKKNNNTGNCNTLTCTWKRARANNCFLSNDGMCRREIFYFCPCQEKGCGPQGSSRRLSDTEFCDRTECWTWSMSGGCRIKMCSKVVFLLSLLLLYSS